MRRLYLLIALGAAAALVLALAAWGHGSHHGKGGKRIHVVERATTDAVVDVGPAGDSLGDTLAFANEVFDKTDTHQVGTDQGSCVRTVVGAAWECSWTTFLSKGQITVQGPFYDDGSDSTLAITGGTGAYRNARGSMELHWRNPAGTEFDFVFRVIG
jgi:hypothetical protein